MVTNRQEKRLGMSVDFHKEFVHTENTVFQFTDCPGFPLYLNNLIKGMHGSQIAVFVVDVNGACLESSLWYFRDQIQATRAFGVNKMIFCVNKMDRKTVQWKQHYFEEICAAIKQLLDKMSIKKEYIKGIIPISSFHGDNLNSKSENMAWYSGPTLLQVLDSIQIQIPPKLATKPFKMTVMTDSFKIPMGTIVCGTVVQGLLKKGMKLYCESKNVGWIVLKIQCGQVDIKEASYGMQIGIQLQNAKRKDLMRGDILCAKMEYPIVAPPRFKTIKSLICEVIMTKMVIYSSKKQCATLHIHALRTNGMFIQLISKIAAKSGQIIENPENIGPYDIGTCKIDVTNSTRCRIWCTTYQENSLLGSIIIREDDQIVGMGIIKEIQFN
ncbi:hypothetical protein FGO68_gene12637 [Halteria grandinella]|uniref:Uncharacterized protein n=1 Tax=Halteria grandinella TaxID=5974 RepID=A0A8J8NR57_HALGN|nr:hypothetical protein FGO68_gene12637 [Halteria grandinella]